MAKYRRYAEDLIGDWETDQYEPQRQVTQSIYNTNLSRLSNSLNDLKDKLSRNFQNAQLDYANTLNNVQGQSFNRLRNADIDLANRGLSTSGVKDLVEQADIQRKGEDVDKALSSLMDVNKASAEGLTEGVLNYGAAQNKLAGELAGDLGKITDQEAGNAQKYANLIASIGEGAAGRAASKARNGTSKAEKEYDEVKRRILIADTLASEELTDEQKKQYLNTYLDVPGDVAISAVDSYNNNKKLSENRAKVSRVQNNLDKYNEYTNIWNNIFGSPVSYAVNPVGSLVNRYILNVPNAARLYAEDSLRKAQNEVNNLTYTDLANLLYGKK